MYTWNSRVRFSEIGEDKRLTLDSILNYFQDSSTFHSEDIGNGMDVIESFTLSFKKTTFEVDEQNFDNRSASVSAARILIKDNVQFDVLPGNRAALEGRKYTRAAYICGVYGSWCG